MRLKAKLKEGEFKFGVGKPYNLATGGRIVIITGMQDTPPLGKQYRVEGHDILFERNCFEWIENE